MGITTESRMTTTDWLSQEEVKLITLRSDARAALQVTFNWLLIAAIFWGVSQWSNPVSWVLGALLLGSRHLGLAILMHEAGHNTLFRTPSLNAAAGKWLCAYPILSDMHAYASSHREHHKLAGTPEDPDLPNYQAYPVSPASFRRKVMRDLSGRTGMRNLLALFKGNGGDIMMRGSDRRPPVTQGLLVNALLFGILLAAGVGELYLMWVIAFIVFYPLAARIRQLAEHGCVADLHNPDPRMNTRTTRANLLERLLICPNHVNYHCEHHFMASVPSYRLKRLHRLLVAKGFYGDHPDTVATGYLNVLRQALANTEQPPAASI